MPQVLYPIIENLLTFNVLEAKKIAYAQSILSGIADSGDLGGEAMSDVDIRVRARNEAVYSSLGRFIDEYYDSDQSGYYNYGIEKSHGGDKIDHDNEDGNSSDEGKVLNIAVLYGAYHILDLQQRIRRLGFTEVNNGIVGSSGKKIDSMTVWDMTYPNLFNKDGEISTSKNISSSENKVLKMTVRFSRKFVISIASVFIYLAVGALDWWSITNFLVCIHF